MQLSNEERTDFLTGHARWSLDGETISRTFVFGGFPQAIAFVTECSFAAEAADHHPDIDVRWNKVTMTLTTHSASALTTKDTDLAAAFDVIAGPPA
jgi:4a-hydroxytetrahydrobiopterin dehydratase